VMGYGDRVARSAGPAVGLLVKYSQTFLEGLGREGGGGLKMRLRVKHLDSRKFVSGTCCMFVALFGTN
jgi:hypothetical protein